MSQNNEIKKLSEVFVDYKIYPKGKYNKTTPIGWFLNEYPNDYYSKNFKDFLDIQNYSSKKRGADLPFWGKLYFSQKKGKRIFIIAQDSLSLDAGSVVFWIHLFDKIENKSEYEGYLNNLLYGFCHFSYKSFCKWKNIFKEWNLDLNFIYVTDAKKVYQENSRDKFNNKQNKGLLEKEIDFCKPNLIIILGNTALKMLKGIFLKDYDLMNDKILKIKNIDCLVSPFPTGQGRANCDFIKRKKIFERQLKKFLKNKNFQKHNFSI